MTREEFENYYARFYKIPDDSNVRDWLREFLGIEAIECDCGGVGCDGWRAESVRPVPELKSTEEDSDAKE